MNWKWKTFFIIITLLIYLSLYYVSMKYLSDLYWFEWTRRHRYVWTWVFAIGFILGNRIFISFSITVGNLAGVIIGQYLGDRIQAYTIISFTQPSRNRDLAVYTLFLCRHWRHCREALEKESACLMRWENNGLTVIRNEKSS